MDEHDAETVGFADLYARVRTGDHEAAAQLLAEYEPQIRRVIRVRMTDPRLRRELDSLDISQSVMADFFVRSAMGQFEITTPAQLIALLATMARNKLLNQVERQQTQKRGAGHVEPQDVRDLALADRGATASHIIASREMLQLVQDQLTDEERQIAQQRADGRVWAEIAKQVNATPDAVRVRFTRAITRVMDKLGISGSISC